MNKNNLITGLLIASFLLAGIQLWGWLQVRNQQQYLCSVVIQDQYQPVPGRVVEICE